MICLAGLETVDWLRKEGAGRREFSFFFLVVGQLATMWGNLPEGVCLLLRVRKVLVLITPLSTIQ